MDELGRTGAGPRRGARLREGTGPRAERRDRPGAPLRLEVAHRDARRDARLRGGRIHHVRPHRGCARGHPCLRREAQAGVQGPLNPLPPGSAIDQRRRSRTHTSSARSAARARSSGVSTSPTGSPSTCTSCSHSGCAAKSCRAPVSPRRDSSSGQRLRARKTG